MELGLVDRAPAVERMQLRARRRLGLVGQLGILEEPVRDVDPDPVDAAVEPETEDLLELGLDVRVVPVEVGLLAREEVQVVPARLLVERPGRAAEHREPVVRLVGPHVVVGVLAEPRMLDRRVVRDEVDHDLQVERMCVAEQRVEVGERAEPRIHAAVVRHVVTVIGPGRRKERRDPEPVDAELRRYGSRERTPARSPYPSSWPDRARSGGCLPFRPVGDRRRCIPSGNAANGGC